jgi:hypothetical protein
MLQKYFALMVFLAVVVKGYIRPHPVIDDTFQCGCKPLLTTVKLQDEMITVI